MSTATVTTASTETTPAVAPKPRHLRPAGPRRDPATPPRTLGTLGASAHLTPEQITEIGVRLDALRARIVASRGAEDAAYIRKVITVQRGLETAGRVTLMAGVLPPAWLAGTAMLSVAKILENMEIGHNVMHGQWDWMRDPEIHSTTWEWDHVSDAESWKFSHNVEHHTYTNVMGRDKDVGYRILRMSADQKWHPAALGQLGTYALLALFFDVGVALHDLEIEELRAGRKSRTEFLGHAKRIGRKALKQLTKDYVAFPALAGPFFAPVLVGNLTANLARNLWTNAIIFCGHFPDGADVFTEEQLEGETRGDWYVRQMLGSANIEGSPLFHIMSGNLSHQIEHHLFPDLPSNRYAEMSVRIQEICERYAIPYTTGPFLVQYAQTLRTMLKLSLPDTWLTATTDDAPETASEKKWELRAAAAARTAA